MTPAQFARSLAKIGRAAGRGEQWRKRATKHLQREADAKPVTSGSRLLGHELPGGKMVCVKTRYGSEDDAMADVTHICRLPGLNVKPSRAYYCRHCCGFHLTSQAYNPA